MFHTFTNFTNTEFSCNRILDVLSRLHSHCVLPVARARVIAARTFLPRLEVKTRVVVLPWNCSRSQRCPRFSLLLSGSATVFVLNMAREFGGKTSVLPASAQYLIGNQRNVSVCFRICLSCPCKWNNACQWRWVPAKTSLCHSALACHYCDISHAF